MVTEVQTTTIRKCVFHHTLSTCISFVSGLMGLLISICSAYLRQRKAQKKIARRKRSKLVFTTTTASTRGHRPAAIDYGCSRYVREYESEFDDRWQQQQRIPPPPPPLPPKKNHSSSSSSRIIVNELKKAGMSAASATKQKSFRHHHDG